MNCIFAYKISLRVYVRMYEDPFINILLFYLPDTCWLTYDTIYLSWQDMTLALDQKRWKKAIEKKQQRA
jgi:hypothetical protein